MNARLYTAETPFNSCTISYDCGVETDRSSTRDRALRNTLDAAPKRNDGCRPIVGASSIRSIKYRYQGSGYNIL